ncbi:MAG: hypothetical protein GX774_15025 [Armatimonadetes bacterium]|jgi:uncharacterized protein YdeI (BOF family)|nr:hypothetical protein [Armatimonadota bacterium]
MKSAAIVVVVLAVLAAAIYLVAGPSGGQADLGQGVPAEATITTIGELTANPEAYNGKEVVVKGKLTEECPSSGCWGVVNDGTGSIRFDTAASGWAMPLGKTGSEITVRGSVSVSETGTPQIAAIGAKL